VSITKKIDAVTHIPPEYRAEILPPPRAVKIELTAKCNFRCAFCATGKGLRPKGEMDQGLFKRLAREMREAGVQELGVFYLGEPFLTSYLTEAIRYAKKELEFPYVFATTNGSVASPEKMRAAFRAGLNSLKFSYNYANSQQFQEVARVNPKQYENLIRNIIAAPKVRDEVERETGHRCNLYASYIQYEGDQADKMEKAVSLIRDRMDEVYALPLYSQAGYIKDQLEEKDWTATQGNMGRIGGLVDPLPCWAVFTEGHILYTGGLSACCFDHTDKFVMADLNEVSFLDGWNSERFQWLRRAHLNKDVRGTPCEFCAR